MGHPSKPANEALIEDFTSFAQLVDYSLMNTLVADPESTQDGHDHRARQVRSGHYVPVTPTPLPKIEYVAHSASFFKELGLSDKLIEDELFCRAFSGDLSAAPPPMKRYGWATGYALSIYGTEYTQQCPFQTGNGYGDGRAISILEIVVNGQRWEMQLKGAGPTPYCRGADGRAVLRSSVREFLAQEHMHALGIPTSRSFTLFTSTSETVTRPWYSQGSYSSDPDILVENPVAISTRVAPSFLRVGQIELFARRVRNDAHPKAREELRLIVEHLIEREYRQEIDANLNFPDQLIRLATLFCQRLTNLVANWLRVGYCQGNFNSDNCAAGGFTLDYGPFGFCEIFDPEFQPWTGGGQHFSFFNQPIAAETNFHMFWMALRPLFDEYPSAVEEFEQVRRNFSDEMQKQIKSVWAQKLGLAEFNVEIFSGLMRLMTRSHVDFTLLFRELSHLPTQAKQFQKCFYAECSEDLENDWQQWLDNWHESLGSGDDLGNVSKLMKQVNPKYTWREWLVVPAYEQAAQGDYSLINELIDVFSKPYDEQSSETENKYYRLKPPAFINAGGVSHYSCSS